MSAKTPDSEWRKVRQRTIAHLRKEPGSNWREIAEGIGYAGGHALQAALIKRGDSLSSLRQAAGHKGGLLGRRIRAREEPKEPIDRQLAHVRAENRRLETVLRAQEKRLDARASLDADILAAVRGLTPYPPERRKARRQKACIAAALCLCDWHTGERISAEETEGYNAYDWRIEQARALYAVRKFLDWIDVQRKGYQIDECVIPLLGDFVSGEIHDELIRTNEFPPTTAAAKAGWLLAECIARIAPKFETVRVEAVTADNHGRLDRKKPAKQKGERNWNTVVYAIAEQALKRHDNLTWRAPLSQKFEAKIAGKTFLLEHGDNIQGWMGLPHYGFDRMRGREAAKRMNRGGFDYILAGHWHHGWHRNGIYGIGALSGVSELDEGQGRNAPPSQTAFLCHSRHGIYNLLELDLSEAK